MNDPRYVVPTAILCLLGLLCPATSDAQRFVGQPATQVRFAGPSSAGGAASAAPVSSKNFQVYAADPVMANRVAEQAEYYRKKLAIEWLGHELPDWSQPCPIQVNLAMDAGGETSFAFLVDEQGNGTPVDWDMKIFGPHDRLLDAVLPHEITHTIFATHFGRPLPRWADEGACTTVEHVSERDKNHQMLIRFLTAKPSRGIPFNRMFTLKNYPHDILPLYAQGYSLAKFLIFQTGQREFLDYVAAGMEYENQMPPLAAWNRATQEHFQYQDLSELQLAWQGWVRSGSQAEQVSSFSKMSGQDRGTTVAFNSADTVETKVGDSNLRQATWPQPSDGSRVRSLVELEGAPAVAQSSRSSNEIGGWYQQQMRNRTAAAEENRNQLRKSPATENIQDSRASDRIWR